MTSRRSGTASPAEADALRAYLRAIAKCPRVTADEERELGQRIQQDQDEEALRRLVESNLRFVVSYAKRYRGFGVPFLDLIHQGNLGLIESARRFDPGRNVKFITYAVWWIRQAILHALSDQARVVSLPSKLSGLAARLNREVAALRAQLDRMPTQGEIAAGLDIPEEDVDGLLRLSATDVSLNDRLGGGDDGDGIELGDTLEQECVPPAEQEAIQHAMIEQVQAALHELDEKERQVMEARFGLSDDEPRTLQEIGDRLHLSRERIRQIEARAKDKMRRSKGARGLRSYLN